MGRPAGAARRATTAGAPWSVANVLTAGDAAAFGDPNAVLGAEVPYFFTRSGYEKSYLLGLASVQKDWRKDAWVLGSEAQSLTSELGDLRQGVAGLYAADYIAAWERIVSTMKPAGYFNNPVAYGAFTKSPSPLKRVLLELRRNTTFQGGAKDVTGRLIRQRLQRTRGGVIANDIASQRETGLDAGGQIQSHFRDLHDYSGNGQGQAPIDEFVNAIKNAGRAVMAARIELTMAKRALERRTTTNTEPMRRSASLMARNVVTASPPSSTSATPGSARKAAATRSVRAGSERRKKRV